MFELCRTVFRFALFVVSYVRFAKGGFEGCVPVVSQPLASQRNIPHLLLCRVRLNSGFCEPVIKDVSIMEMPCVATSREGFVCQVVQYMTHGYPFYVVGDTRNDRNLLPDEIDRNIARKFHANLSRGRREVRRKHGKCNCRYIRYGKDWVLWSTYGKGEFFEEHKSRKPDELHRFFDIREMPIRFHGYQISLSKGGFEKKTADEKAEYRVRKQRQKAARERGDEYDHLPRGTRHQKWVGRVCIHAERYEEIRAEALGLAVHRNADYLRQWFFHQPYLPYAPIRWQLKTLLREVNKLRRHAFGKSFDPVPDDAIRFLKKHVPAFKPIDDPALIVNESQQAA